MPEVRVGDNESIESALKRFKKKIQKAGILSEIKRRERYEKPSVYLTPKPNNLKKFLMKFNILPFLLAITCPLASSIVSGSSGLLSVDIISKE